MQNCLQNLEIYLIAIDMSRVAWKVYSRMDWRTKKIIGDQFITSMDSIGANIAEDYGRFHYLDRIKFFYNSRGSFYEAVYHWSERLMERCLIDNKDYDQIMSLASDFIPKLNGYIKSTYNAKETNSK